LLVNFSSNTYSKDKLPEPIIWDTDLKGFFFDNDEIQDGSKIFSLETPYRALDAAIVPITVKFKQKQSENNHVKSLSLIIDENPSPLVGKFEFTPKMGDPSFTTRIRVDKYTYVRAVIEMNDGKKFMVANYVKAAGGCSAPALADMDSIMARLGKMKMKFIKTGKKGEINKAQFLISHPNYSGLQFNQLTRSEIPAHFVNFIRIEQDGNLIFQANPDISLSEDPSFTFNYIDSGGPLKVTVKDSDGLDFAGEFPTSNIVSAK
tara:strand:- start:607 stop:1392 length:786 start_codon:yes stop_codon:yes gene_type:complete